MANVKTGGSNEKVFDSYHHWYGFGITGRRIFLYTIWNYNKNRHIYVDQLFCLDVYFDCDGCYRTGGIFFAEMG